MISEVNRSASPWMLPTPPGTASHPADATSLEAELASGTLTFVDLTSGWTFVAIVGEGDPVDLGGVNPWSVGWVPVAVGNVTVSHPSYPRQLREMSVYKIADTEPSVFFAAGEFSNGAWGFYLPTESMHEFLARHHP